MQRLIGSFLIILFLTIATASMADAGEPSVLITGDKSMGLAAYEIFTTHPSMEALVEKIKALKSSEYPLLECRWTALKDVRIIETSKIEFANVSQRKFLANQSFHCENTNISASVTAVITLRKEASDNESKLSLEGLEGIDLNVDDLVANF